MEDKKLELAKALNTYLKEKRTQDECTGFIDGFEKCQDLFDMRIVSRSAVKKDCVFCDIAKINSNVITIGNCLVFEPLNPVTKGHLLVVNKTHTKDFTDDSNVFSETCKIASEIAKEKGGDFNLITSKGLNATQSVFHTHIHLVPRTDFDGLNLPWTNQTTK